MNRLFIDANLLCLVVAGLFAPSAIGRHKRLKAFTLGDFNRVQDLASKFAAVVTCPHVLTETSNLLSQTNDDEKEILLFGLKSILNNIEEINIPANEASDRSEYKRLGLTDAVLLTLNQAKSALLTTDLALTLAAQNAGNEAINFNWVRDNG